MSDTIRAIIFDIGGVLLRTTDHTGREAWEKRLGLPPGGAESIVLNSEMGHRAQRGEITTAQLWQWVGDYLELGGELEDFRRDFWRGDTVDADLVELLDALRGRYQLGVISNAGDTLIETLAAYNLLHRFDLIVGSAYEGIMKPDHRIYERALARLGREPQETVFIDDAPRNIEAAHAIGMKAILYSPRVDLRAELAGLGVGL